ncbi:unnamed protein product, partial [Closterium sp. NIES-54]
YAPPSLPSLCPLCPLSALSLPSLPSLCPLSALSALSLPSLCPLSALSLPSRCHLFSCSRSVPCPPVLPSPFEQLLQRHHICSSSPSLFPPHPIRSAQQKTLKTENHALPPPSAHARHTRPLPFSARRPQILPLPLPHPPPRRFHPLFGISVKAKNGTWYTYVKRGVQWLGTYDWATGYWTCRFTAPHPRNGFNCAADPTCPGCPRCRGWRCFRNMHLPTYGSPNGQTYAIKLSCNQAASCIRATMH